MDAVKIRVPGTSANIGPGFDSLGCAFNIYNMLTFTRAANTTVTGCPAAYANEDNLALQAFRAACRRAGREACPVSLHIETSVPVSRGLGSSATLIVGGALGADRLLSLGLTKTDIFEIANELEGHPDNVAPATFGGFTACMVENGHPYATQVQIHPTLRFCALVPDFELPTSRARAVLPATVPFGDAVRNLTHVAVLLSAIRDGNTDLIRRALSDRLHEPYRRPLIPGFAEAEREALALGAHAFFISGSGSTCMAIYTDEAFPAALTARIAALLPTWRVLSLEVDRDGAIAL
ncbi:MAG: homoserine kinase [Clostridia bacterium]|nr:homoserine kinase [Clostridia bacterium]